MEHNKYYNGDTLLSHRKLYNWVIGHRGVGKTYYFKRLCIRKFLKKGEQFVWVRRYKTELTEVKSKWLKDISNLFPDNKIFINGNNIYVDDKIAGYFIPLSVSSKYKSSSFPLVTSIVFDEFLIDKSTFKYLKDEVVVFLDLYETIARDRNNVYAFFIGNAISFYNPYFLFFGIQQTKKEFYLDNEICVQHYKNEIFIEEKKKSRFGQLIHGTEYEKYAVENEYLLDNNIFIAKRTKNAYFRCCFFFNNKYLGIWKDLEKGLLYVDNTYDNGSDRIFTLKTDDHRPNMLMLKGIKNSFSKEIKFCFYEGLIRFSDQNIKKMFYELITYL